MLPTACTACRSWIYAIVVTLCFFLPLNAGNPSATRPGYYRFPAIHGDTIIFTAVDNLPNATFTGGDAQLDAAVKYLEEEIRKDPRPVPQHPAYPNKAFKYSQ